MQFVWSFKANREQRVRIECAANRVPIELVISLIFCKSVSNAYRPDRKTALHPSQPIFDTVHDSLILCYNI